MYDQGLLSELHEGIDRQGPNPAALTPITTVPKKLLNDHEKSFEDRQRPQFCFIFLRKAPSELPKSSLHVVILSVLLTNWQKCTIYDKIFLDQNMGDLV